MYQKGIFMLHKKKAVALLEIHRAVEKVRQGDEGDEGVLQHLVSGVQKARRVFDDEVKARS